MSATEFRPGDIAMVDGKPAVWLRLQDARQDGSPIELWRWLDGDWRWWTSKPAEVGPVLGNVADIASGVHVVHIQRDDGVSLARVQPESRPAETQHNRRSDHDVQEARRETVSDLRVRVMERRDQFVRQTGATAADFGCHVYADVLAAINLYAFGHGLDDTEVTP